MSFASLSLAPLRSALMRVAPCSAREEFVLRGIWEARLIYTFGSNLIERLGTRSVDVQPQNQLREG